MTGPRHPARLRHPHHTAVVAGLVLATAAGCRAGHTEPAQAPPPIMIRVAPVEHAERARPIESTGVLAAKSEVRASFKVGGLIRAIAVDEGAAVRRGQVLATLDATEIAAAVAQAREGVTKAERDHARVAELVGGRAATGAQLEDVTTGLAIARAQLRSAEFNLAHTVIRAPRDGRVLHRLAQPDELVGPGQPVLVLSGNDRDWVLRVGLADRDVVRLQLGDVATLRFPAWPELPPLRATVSELAAAATPPLGTYEVELKVEAAGRPLRAGLVAHATIVVQAHERVALIPALALRDGDGRRATVWIKTATGVARRAVETAFFDGDRVAIRRGLEDVAQVVTDGAAYLVDGSRVEVAR